MGGCVTALNLCQKNLKLNLDQKLTLYPNVDEKYYEGFSQLRRIEDFKNKYLFLWNVLLIKTGAIVLKNPTMKTILWGYIWIIAYEIPETKNREFSKVLTLKPDSSYVSINGFEMDVLPNNVVELTAYLNEYFQFIFEDKEISELLRSVKTTIKNLQEISYIPEKLFKGVSVNPLEIKIIKKYCKDNFNEITKGEKILEGILKNMSQSKANLSEMNRVIQGEGVKEDDLKLDNIHNVAERARENNWESHIEARIMIKNEKSSKRITKIEDIELILNHCDEELQYLQESMQINKEQDPRVNSQMETNSIREEENLEAPENYPMNTEVNRSLLKKTLRDDNKSIRSKQSRSKKESLDGLVGKNIENINSRSLFLINSVNLNTSILKWNKSFQPEGNIKITCLESLPDLGLVAVGDQSGNISLFDYQNLNIIHSFTTTHNGPVKMIRCLNDKLFILSGGEDGTLIIHSVVDKNSNILSTEEFSMENIYVRNHSTANTANELVITTNNFALTSIINENKIEMKKIHKYLEGSNIIKTHFEKELEVMCIYAGDKIDILNLNTGELVTEFSCINKTISCLSSFSKQESWYLIYLEVDESESNKETEVVVYDIQVKREIKRLKTDLTSCSDLIYLFDEENFSFISNGNLMVTYNLERNEVTKCYRPKVSNMCCGDYSGPDAKTLFIGCEDGSIEFWSYENNNK